MIPEGIENVTVEPPVPAVASFVALKQIVALVPFLESVAEFTVADPLPCPDTEGANTRSEKL